jgi:hypothetical protein
MGRGDGRIATDLEPRPADLTRIAVRRGVFDPDTVASYIDGRVEVARHGPREMPVWGRTDRAEPQVQLTPGRIGDIVAYLATLQVARP